MAEVLENLGELGSCENLKFCDSQLRQLRQPPWSSQSRQHFGDELVHPNSSASAWRGGKHGGKRKVCSYTVAKINYSRFTEFAYRVYKVYSFCMFLFSFYSFCSKLTLQTGPELLWHVFQLFIRQIKRVWLHLGCGFTYKPPYCRYRSICLPSYPIWKIKQNVWFKMVQGKFDDFSAGAASACTTTQHIHRSLLTWEGSLAALAGLRKWLERLKNQFYSQRNCNGRSRAKPNKEMEKKQFKKKNTVSTR